MSLEAVHDAVPELRHAESVAPLPGGLTNTNYKVVAGKRAYVVRISSKDSGLLAIDRQNELHNTIAAAEAGVGAPFVAGCTRNVGMSMTVPVWSWTTPVSV